MRGGAGASNDACSQAYHLYHNQDCFHEQFVQLQYGGIRLADYLDLVDLIEHDLYRIGHNKDRIKICELGCWTGRSTILLATIAKWHGGHVTTVDDFGGNENLIDSAARFDIKEIFESNIRLHHLTEFVTIIKSATQKAAPLLENDYFDVLFIDADHDPEPVRQDIIQYVPKVKQGGLVCGHDFDHEGVGKAVREFFPEFAVANGSRDSVTWYAKRK